MGDIEVLKRVLHAITEEPLTMHQLCCLAKIDVRTLQKYIEMIELIQTSGQYFFERKGLRYYVRKSKRVM